MSDEGNSEKLILAYGLPASSAEGKRLRELASEKTIRIEDVALADFYQLLGYIAHQPGFAKKSEIYEGPKPEHTIIWFVNVSREEVGWLLQAYSLSDSVKSIDLKSMITPHNINWTLEEHYKELQQEHRMMQMYTFLLHAKSAFDSLEPSDYTKESLQTLEKDILSSQEYVEKMQKGQEIDLESFALAANKVKSSFQNLIPNV